MQSVSVSVPVPAPVSVYVQMQYHLQRCGAICMPCVCSALHLLRRGQAGEGSTWPGGHHPVHHVLSIYLQYTHGEFCCCCLQCVSPSANIRDHALRWRCMDGTLNRPPGGWRACLLAGQQVWYACSPWCASEQCQALWCCWCTAACVYGCPTHGVLL
jgi:hypothetical protein